MAGAAAAPGRAPPPQPSAHPGGTATRDGRGAARSGGCSGDAPDVGHAGHAVELVRDIVFVSPAHLFSTPPNRASNRPAPGVWRLWVLLESTRALASAVAALHDAQLVHCDVKPGNVLVGQPLDPTSPWQLPRVGEVRLGDWGLVRVVDPTTQRLDLQGGGVGGTPGFMAPEHLAAAMGLVPPSAVALTPALDVWGVAATAVALLLGRPIALPTQRDLADLAMALVALCDQDLNLAQHVFCVLHRMLSADIDLRGSMWQREADLAALAARAAVLVGEVEVRRAIAVTTW